MQRPDFVIVGAAKSGTTALHHYLTQHPAVFMPLLKEPGYFSSDLPGGIQTFAHYRELFAAAPLAQLTGEASTQYLYSQVAVARLMQHNPAVKVIAILRHPVEAAQSLHAFAYRYGHEQIADFESAWHTQPQRLAREVRTGSRPAAAIHEYDYRATFAYAEQVGRVLALVPAAQRHFVLYEDFFASPATHYAALLEFLGLPAVMPSQFDVVNPHVDMRAARLENLVRRPPGLLRSLYAPFRPLLRAANIHPGRLLLGLKWRQGPRREISADFRAELERHFAADVVALERLLGRPLWPRRVAADPGTRA